MKYRSKPRCVYLEWIGEEKQDQEVIWCKKSNDGKIKAHAGGFLKLITVNLDPNGNMAMKDSRHPISMAGFGHTVYLISRDNDILMKNPTWGSVKDLGESMEFGAKSICYEATLDKAKHPKFYAYKARICMDKKTKMPNHVQIWDKEDGKVRLVEDYGYKKIKLNVGLKDTDFDPDNKAYRF